MAMTTSRRTSKQNFRFRMCACLRGLPLSFRSSVRLNKFTLQNDLLVDRAGDIANKKASIQALFVKALCGMVVALRVSDAVRGPAQCW